MRERLPTRHEVLGLFLLCVAGGHSWATLVFFHQLPAYLQQMQLLSALRIFAYTQVFVLGESIVVAAVLILVCIAPPGWLQPGRYMGHGGLLYAAFFLAFLPHQFQASLLQWLAGDKTLYRAITIGWLMLCLIGLFTGVVWLCRRSVLEARLASAVEKMGLLGGFYLIVDIIFISALVIISY